MVRNLHHVADQLRGSRWASSPPERYTNVQTVLLLQILKPCHFVKENGFSSLLLLVVLACLLYRLPRVRAESLVS